jgi:DNA polymerase-3 subunit delta'
MAFDDITGHDRSISILNRAVTSGKTAHAYLFEGIDGCGKRKTALALIQALFCSEGTGCGTCPSCLKLRTDNHPDLHLLEPDGTFIKIDQIRELQKELSFRPYEAKRKACIIEAADKLNISAANALLKTLEEPPGSAIIILLTTEANAILPTIRSRCQLLRFAPLPRNTIRDYLIAHGISHEVADSAANLARGSLGKALEISQLNSLAQRSSLLAELCSFSLSAVSDLFAASERLSADKTVALESLEALITFLRDLLTFSCGGEDIVNQDMLPLLEQEATRLSPDRVMERISFVTEARQALQFNANPRLTLDLLFMRLARA